MRYHNDAIQSAFAGLAVSGPVYTVYCRTWPRNYLVWKTELFPTFRTTRIYQKCKLKLFLNERLVLDIIYVPTNFFVIKLHAKILLCQFKGKNREELDRKNKLNLVSMKLKLHPNTQ